MVILSIKFLPEWVIHLKYGAICASINRYGAPSGQFGRPNEYIFILGVAAFLQPSISMNKITIQTPAAAHAYFLPRLSSTVEEFWVAALNSQKEVLGSHCLFRGTVDHCLFHPRDIVRYACLMNACSIIVAHNHPSGNIWPSPEDLALTEQLLTVFLIVEIPLVDHLILGGGDYFSFLVHGKLNGSKSLV